MRVSVNSATPESSPERVSVKKSKRVHREHLMPSPSRIRSPPTTRLSRTISPTRSESPEPSQKAGPAGFIKTLDIPTASEHAATSYLDAASSYMGPVS